MWSWSSPTTAANLRSCALLRRLFGSEKSSRLRGGCALSGSPPSTSSIHCQIAASRSPKGKSSPTAPQPFQRSCLRSYWKSFERGDSDILRTHDKKREGCLGSLAAFSRSRPPSRCDAARWHRLCGLPCPRERQDVE